MNQDNKIGLFSVIVIAVTSMIGSGWLFSAQLNAQLAGNYAFIAWIIAAAVAIIVGLCFSRLCILFPERGINAKCTSISHGKDFGMIFAFAIWFGLLAMIPTEAQATTQYLSPFIKFVTLYQNDALTITGKFAALVILLVYFIINYFGITLLAKVNNISTVFKVSIPLLTIIILLAAHFDTTNFNLSANANEYTLKTVKTALIGAGLIYAFNGFQVVAAFASEIKNPQRNVPLAIIISILFTLGIYMLLQLAFMGAIPTEIAIKGWSQLNFNSPLVNLTMLLGLNFIVIALIADSIVSPSITGMTYLDACSRMLYAMAEQGQMPRWIAKLCPKHNLSKRSLILNFIISAIILFNSSSWAALMVLTTAFNILGYIGAPLALGVLDKKRRFFYGVVFVMLGLLLSTLNTQDFILSNLAISVMMVIYAGVQLKNGKRFNLRSFSFIAYLWILMLVAHLNWAVVILAFAFFFYATGEKFTQQSKILNPPEAKFTSA
ncbi:L-aspartate transporter [Piscirickettsia salmonis]|uniref:APC family permease n=1 Tax=Piscirickettsia salmonis TaxID=1238 RepID=UPI00050A25EB|nr:APC family permease [Piscirickettsia salmonis]QGN80605.1 L-aspartate transporter [Piscirickettsia salmonis]QGO30305.1 L-aspartate transporter [Piscirickettsia salmonis]QGP46190.1 L-aspartate transporter [Piscirickettsia salmonis]